MKFSNNFSNNELNKIFQNVLILKDETSLNILNEICEEQNIPLKEFVEFIIWQYQNKNSTLTGVNKVIDKIIDNME